MTAKFSCGLILLAAGASTRMGRPKQLLPVHGKPLLRHMVESALAEPVSPVVVVLGANATEIAPCLDGLPVRIVINADWAEGMGSSLRRGMKELTEITPTAISVIIALADQPDIFAGHITKLIEVQRMTSQPIVASECDGVCGPPALFTDKFFSSLLALHGNAGARSLLQAHPDEVATIPLPQARDLDTLADYSEYLGRQNPEQTR
jgi:molybdenum cofactor cytidylyltransferase